MTSSALWVCQACGRIDQDGIPARHMHRGRRCDGVPELLPFTVVNGSMPVPPLIGVARAAEALGVSKAGGLQRLRESGRMPAPVADVPDVPSPVYRRSEIDELATELEFERTQREARRQQQTTERTPS